MDERLTVLDLRTAAARHAKRAERIAKSGTKAGGVFKVKGKRAKLKRSMTAAVTALYARNLAEAIEDQPGAHRVGDLPPKVREACERAAVAEMRKA